MPTHLFRSRAFWNLRAEQVMDRVFDPSEPALKAVKVAVLPQEASTQANVDRIKSSTARRQGLLTSITIVAAVGVGTSLWLAQNWQRTLQSLNRERDLQMIERLRSMPVAGGDSMATTASAATTGAAARPTAAAADDDSIDDSPRIASLQPLSIPLAGTIPAPTGSNLSDDAIASAMVPAEPRLVGVVHAGGGQDSAIFQLDQVSLSATPGDAIGNSGWRLKTVQANGAVIEHNGKERSLSVGGAF